MRLLLDTHIAVWAALDPQSLSAAERRLLDDMDEPPALSSVSVWELRLKWDRFHASGERKGPVAPGFLVQVATTLDWRMLNLTASHAAQVLTDRLDHQDPFDRLLLVQAQEEGLRLLTRDRQLVDHPLAIGSA